MPDKPPDSIILPHLTREELSDRDLEESRLHRQLRACWRGDYFDVERALNVMRDSAIEIFRIMYSSFRKRIGYRTEWLPEIVNLAIFRTLHEAEDSIRHGFPRDTLGELDETLESALNGHIEEMKSIESQADTKSAFASPKAAAQNSNPSEREALRNAYRAAFPDVKIADIIWAAKQTRREWTRWITGEAKDGLRPDRSFRHVLTSGKKPEQIMGKPRPTKYTT